MLVCNSVVSQCCGYGAVALYSLYQKVQMVSRWPSPKNQHLQKKPSWWKVRISFLTSVGISACGGMKAQADTGMIMVESVYCLLRQLLLSFFVGLFICCHLSWFWRGWGTQRQLLSLAFCRITARKCSDNKLPCRPSQNSFFFF